MHLTVNGKQLDVGDALREHVADSLRTAVGKYFSNPIDANVVMSREAHLFRADVSVHAGRGILLRSDGQAESAHGAFDIACEKVAKRLRRHKRRLRDHHGAGGNGADKSEPLTANQYILHGPKDDGGEDEAADDQPVVVAEMTTSIESLTVSEAVMRMEFADVPALLFRNRAHGGFNMVYRRPDGHVGWVDPANTGTADS